METHISPFLLGSFGGRGGAPFLVSWLCSGKHHLLPVKLPFFGEAVLVAALHRMRSILEGWEEAHQPH